MAVITPLDTALRIAADAHFGQHDKAGLPYILHVCRVVDRVRGESGKVVAALHDVLEDSDLTVEDLAAEGYRAGVLDAIVTITRRAGETYADYIRRVKADPLATLVKLADLRENLDGLTVDIDPTGSLRTRYTKALAFLRGDDGVEPVD